MKNHSGRRSFLQFGTSRRNRIISLCILPLVLLLSILGSSRTVYASAYAGDNNIYPLTGFTVTNSSTTAQCIPVGFISDGLYYDLTYQNNTYDLVLMPTSGYIEVIYKGIVNFREFYTFPSGVNSQSYFLFYCSGNTSSTYDFYDQNIPATATISRVSIENISHDCNYPNYGSYVFPSSVSASGFRTLYSYNVESNFKTSGIVFTQDYEVSIVVRIYDYATDFNSVLAGVAFSHISLNNTFYDQNYSCSYSENSLRDILSTVNYNLYESWNQLDLIRRQLIFNSQTSNFASQLASQLNSNSTSEQNAINSAASQAALDAQTAQSQAADIIDDINYDHSGTSQSVSATQSAYDAAQGLADTAVDNAVHNYVGDLSTVEAYDYSSFFTSQRNSAVFWRDVGEFILDSNNLGFVSGSIIIVTLIGLVIFMLRL